MSKDKKLLLLLLVVMMMLLLYLYLCLYLYLFASRLLFLLFHFFHPLHYFISPTPEKSTDKQTIKAHIGNGKPYISPQKRGKALGSKQRVATKSKPTKKWQEQI